MVMASDQFHTHYNTGYFTSSPMISGSNTLLMEAFRTGVLGEADRAMDSSMLNISLSLPDKPNVCQDL